MTSNMDYQSIPWMSLPPLLTPMTNAAAFEASSDSLFFNAFNPSTSAFGGIAPLPTLANDDGGAAASIAPGSTIAPGALAGASGSSSSSPDPVAAWRQPMGPFTSALLQTATPYSLGNFLPDSSSNPPTASTSSAEARRASSSSSSSSRAPSPPTSSGSRRSNAQSSNNAAAPPAAKRTRTAAATAGEGATSAPSSKPPSKRRPRKMTDKRREQNRLAQKNLRARRAAQYEEYHDRVEALEKENSELRSLISALRSENGSLRTMVPTELQSALINIPLPHDTDHTDHAYTTDEAGSPASSHGYSL